MESIEGGAATPAPPTTAAVSVEVADTSADDNVVTVEEVPSPDAIEGEADTNAAANNNAAEDSTNYDADTINEETVEENTNTDALTNNNDIDLLGFTDGGGTETPTENQAEISSSPENNNIAETVSNDMDLLGFGVEEKPQEEEAPVSDENAVNDDVGIEDGEKNDATIPNSEAIDKVPMETEETTSSDPVPDQSDAVENLLSLAPNEPSATVVTLPESTANEVDTSKSTQLNTEEVANIKGDVSEATDTQLNDEALPPVSSSRSENIAMEEAAEGSHIDNNVSDAKDGDYAEKNVETKIDTVEEMSHPPADEPSATIVALPESSDITLNEESTELDVDTNNSGVTPEVTDVQSKVDNTDIQEDMQQGSEGGDAVQTIEQRDQLTPTQNGEEENPNISAPAEAHAAEEADWLSMGLSLGDALRQIVALTDERDSALAFGQEKYDTATQAESLLVEVQVRLEAEMNRRAESDSKARKLLETMKAYEARLGAYERMEDDLEATQANLVTAVSEKSQLELEIAKMREVRDESERKEAVLSNRLNEAKKKEANKSNNAGRLELDNEELRANLESTKTELESVVKAKTKLVGTMEKLKTKAVERVKQAETALKEERELNEERKKKMKVFVETKAEELREAKESAGDMQKELQETRASLTTSREREESIQKELESARIKYREVQRDIERMKRNAEALHNMGNNLEQELEKSATETEEHKKKRISARHELMTMMRTLEGERGASEKLRESMKFTFAPKAQSQQQLLSECLRDLETELDRLSIKLGKALPVQPQIDDSKTEEGMERSVSNGSGKKARRGRSKADMDTERLVSNLEQETQLVSKGIMALVNSIERMRVLLDEDNTFNCMAFFSNQLGLTIGAGEARHQRLHGDEAPIDDREETMSITSFDQR